MIKEEALCERLGITREKAREFRKKMAPGREWALEGRTIGYTDEGTRRFAQLACLDGIPTDAALLVGGAPAAEPEKKTTVTARLVVSAQTSNAEVLLATIPDGELGKLPAGTALETLADFRVRVYVGNARGRENFRRGMRIECRHREKDLWELVGAGPRWAMDPSFL